jgi:hypothetical protein
MGGHFAAAVECRPVDDVFVISVREAAVPVSQ